MSLKYGRKAPKNAPALMLASFLSGAVPAHPTSEDYGSRFTGWQMLGNDQYGDCVAVTWANQRALVSTVLSGKTEYPTQDQVFTFYKTQNPKFPSQDDGMDIQTALEALVKNGGPDGVKAVAFAKVDYTNPAELEAAHAIFGQVWYGVNVLDINQTEFSQGKPWDYVASSPVDGGHSITGVGYTPTDWKFVTWAEEVEWTEAFRTHQVEEAWVVIWPEHLGSAEFEAGIDQVALAADYQAITGKTFPVQPAPKPAPTPPSPPAPTPAPVDADAAYFAKIKPLLTGHHLPTTDAYKLITFAKEWALEKNYHLTGEHEEGFAMGGPIEPGGYYLVGESGPELDLPTL
jgi:hypothetical protein